MTATETQPTRKITERAGEIFINVEYDLDDVLRGKESREVCADSIAHDIAKNHPDIFEVTQTARQATHRFPKVTIQKAGCLFKGTANSPCRRCGVCASYE